MAHNRNDLHKSAVSNQLNHNPPPTKNLFNDLFFQVCKDIQKYGYNASAVPPGIKEWCAGQIFTCLSNKISSNLINLILSTYHNLNFLDCEIENSQSLKIYLINSPAQRTNNNHSNHLNQFLNNLQVANSQTNNNNSNNNTIDLTNNHLPTTGPNNSVSVPATATPSVLTSNLVNGVTTNLPTAFSILKKDKNSNSTSIVTLPNDKSKDSAHSASLEDKSQRDTKDFSAFTETNKIESVKLALQKLNPTTDSQEINLVNTQSDNDESFKPDLDFLKNSQENEINNLPVETTEIPNPKDTSLAQLTESIKQILNNNNSQETSSNLNHLGGNEMQMNNPLVPLDFLANSTEISKPPVVELTALQKLEQELNMRMPPAEERRWKCSLCPKTYGRSSHLARHIKEHHPSVIESIKANSNNSLYSCMHCSSQFTSKPEKDSHLRQVHNDTYKFICEFCTDGDGKFKRLFKYQKNYIEHYKEEHKNSEILDKVEKIFNYREIPIESLLVVGEEIVIITPIFVEVFVITMYNLEKGCKSTIL